MNFLEDNKILVVIHQDMQFPVSKESIDLLLTPQFYTLKKEKLPFRFSYEAKKIAPAIFEGVLEEGYQYDYFVFKEGELWVFIAYSMEQINTFLDIKGIARERLSKLFFAQQMKEAFTIPYLLNKKEILVLVEDTVVLLPRSIAGDEKLTSKLDTVIKPKKGLSVAHTHDSIFSFKQAVWLGMIFILFAVAFIADGVRYDMRNNGIMEEYEALIEDNPSLRSQYTRESIAANYKQIDHNERAKREIIKSISNMRLEGVVLESFILDEKHFSASFSAKDKRLIDQLDGLAKKENFTTRKQGSSIMVEGRV